MTRMNRAGEVGPAPSTLAFELHSRDFHVPPDVAAYAREKLATKLAKFGRRVLTVVVHIKDVNGPKGGPGITCHMEAMLARLEPVNVEERDSDLRAAIDRAMERLELGVQRHVERARSKPRNQGRKVVRHRKLTPPPVG